MLGRDGDLVFFGATVVFFGLVLFVRDALVTFVDLWTTGLVTGAQWSQHSPAVKLAGTRWVLHLSLGHVLTLQFGLAI